MPVTYGLTPTGFVPAPFVVVRADLDARLRQAFGNSIPLGEQTIFGVVNAVMAEQYARLWSLSEAVYKAWDPDAATGQALDALSLITGTFRTAAAASTVVLTLCGSPGTVVPEGSLTATESTSKQFQTSADATIALLPTWVTSTVYAIGDRVTSASRCYQALTAGTSGASQPTTTSADFNDGGVHWRYIGEGTGAVDVDATSVELDAIEAFADDITVKVTPVGGWQSVTNLLDAEPGHLEDTDEQLRRLREAELAAEGTSTADAIRGELLKLEGVISATVFVNDSDVTDANGVPPHAFECLVRGGDDDEIRATIFANTAAGIATYGSTSGVVVDSEGTSHTVKFSRPTLVNIYVDITLTYDSTLYPTDGDTQVKAAIVAFGDLQKTGKDAVAVGIGAQAFKVAGVLDVPRSGSLGGTLIGTAASPTSDATIVITSRQLAVFDTSRIVVHSSSGTP